MQFKVTPNIAAELIAHEAIVREAYKDIIGVWTWGIGVTSYSGHDVHPRYVDNPQTLDHVFEVFEWLVRTNYLPAVQDAFDGFDLTECQLGAALSFNYNTGGIGRAEWVDCWKEGDHKAAYDCFLNWKKPDAVRPRREAERALFFNGIWSHQGTTIEFPVLKPSYRPDFNTKIIVDIMETLERLFP